MKSLKLKRTHIELPLSGRWLRPTIVPLVTFTITLEVFPSKVWFLLNTSKMLSLFNKNLETLMLSISTSGLPKFTTL